MKVTKDQVDADPEYYLAGAGQDEAAESDCPHGYALTSSCPNCDAGGN